MRFVPNAEDEKKYDFWTIQSSHAIKDAAARDLAVVLPNDNQLLLDLDSDEALQVYHKNLPKFQRHVAEVIDEKVTESRNGNTHIVLTLDSNFDPDTRIMFQAFLGSDQTRELLSYIRVINDDPNPTLFVENKPKLLTEGQ